LGALVGGRRSAPWKSLLLTRVRRNRRWLFGTLGLFARSRLAGARQRASEVGRQLGNTVDNTVARQPRSRGALLISLARRAVVDTAEVGGTASIVRPPEVGPPSKRGSASRLSSGFGWSYARSARLTPCAREPERSLGARFGKSVAEVGKKHLPSRTRGEPRGELKLRPGSTSRRRLLTRSVTPARAKGCEPVA
jgi:hypothetical protein